MLGRLLQVAQKLKEAREELAKIGQEAGGEVIAEAFAPCFEGDTPLTRITWDQYTPYFNDGEPCEFSAHDPHFHTNDPEENDYGDETYGLVKRDRPYCNPDNEYSKKRRAELEKKYGASNVAHFAKIWDLLDDDILHAVFGDHQTITVTKDGVTVEDCDHE